MGASISQTLARFCATLTLEAIPPAVRRRAGELALDFLAVAVRATRTPSSAMVRRAARVLSGPGPCTVIGEGARLAPQYAALANGATAHAIELDDVTEESSLHPGVVVFPAALAMAEACGAGPRDLLAAVVVGYEVIGRLGNALDVRAHYARGFHPTATCGTFAAAAVAARLMGLDAARTAHALGIAGSMAAGSMQYLDDGALVKRVHPGVAAHAGIVAARLAAEGLTGPAAVVEGRHGFLRAYCDGGHPERALAGLGEDWQVLATALKPHACCRYNHAAVDAVLDIVRRTGLEARDVARVTARVPASSLGIVAEPRASKIAPGNVVDAQFSLPYAVAVALRHRRAFLDEYTEVHLGDPEIGRLMGLVECLGDDDLERAFPARWGARVEIVTVGGARHEALVPDAKGSPRNPLTPDEVAAKARALTSGLLAPSRQEALIAAAGALEDLPDVASLLEPLATLALRAPGDGRPVAEHAREG